MAWDFETEPEFQRKLDWVNEFVREEVEPLDLLWGHEQFVPVRKDIATAKVVMPTVLHDIAWRAMQVHGALGTTNEMPFFGMIHGAGVMGLADGPTEVHKVTEARQVLRDYKPSDDVWPTEWIPKKLEAAKARFAEHLEHEVGNL